MGYFDYIAKQSFKSAPSGKRLFYRGGPWSRPYLVPDQATEQRLYIRQLWLMRLLLGVLILGQPFLFLLVPEVIREPLWFLGYLIAVTVVSGVAGHLLFRGPLRGLQRAPSRLPIRAFYAEMAHRHSAARSRSGSSAPWRSSRVARGCCWRDIPPSSLGSASGSSAWRRSGGDTLSGSS